MAPTSIYEVGAIGHFGRFASSFGGDFRGRRPAVHALGSLGGTGL